MAVIYTEHFAQFFDANGNPLSGGKLYAYSAGTTTAKATYTTEAATVEQAHPIVLDSAGRATIFIEGSYRFDLYDANDALIESTDNVTSFKTLNESAEPFFQSFSGTGAQTVFTLSEALGTDSKNLMVYVVGGGGEGYEIQNPSAYTLSGTSLTFGSAPASGTDNIYVFAPSKLLGEAAASAAAAAASEAAAASSETNAATSESNAATSETNAAASETAAAASAAASAAEGAAINGYTTAAAIGADFVPFADQSDSGANKKLTITNLSALIGGIATGFTTGDAKLTLKTTADSGWIMADDGSIGSGASGASTRANADTETLYSLLWNNVSDTYAPVSSGRGANAAADFAANKTITLTRTLGRSLGIAGAGASLTSRALGEYLGAETHALTEAELASHTHTATVTDGGHSHTQTYLTSGAGTGNAVTGSAFVTGQTNATNTTASATTGITVANSSTGSGTAHNIMQPTSFWNVMIKL